MKLELMTLNEKKINWMKKFKLIEWNKLKFVWKTE